MRGGDLDGRVAIITGAAMGIGRACAIRMAQQGARVVLADIDEAAGERTRGEIGDVGGVAAFLRTDVTSMADMEAAAALAVERFGTIDILVNNAAQAIGGVVDEIDEATWNRVMTTNLTSVWRGMKVCVPVMKAKRKGAIVNVSSAQALAGFKGWAAYAAAKGGVNALTQQTAVDLAPYSIRVNAVAPGTIMTPGPGVFAFDLATGEGGLWYSGALVFANGLALAPDGSALYVCETFARRVTRIAIEPDGRAGAATPFAVDLPGLPDGIAFDERGCLFCGCYEPSRILRISPDGVTVQIYVEDPTAHVLAHPTNLAFDGAVAFCGKSRALAYHADRQRYPRAAIVASGCRGHVEMSSISPDQPRRFRLAARSPGDQRSSRRNGVSSAAGARALRASTAMAMMVAKNGSIRNT